MISLFESTNNVGFFFPNNTPNIRTKKETKRKKKKKMMIFENQWE